MLHRRSFIGQLASLAFTQTIVSTQSASHARANLDEAEELDWKRFSYEDQNEVTVRLPPGRFIISETLVPTTKHFKLFGDKSGSTELINATPGKPLIALGVGGRLHDSITISNVKLCGSESSCIQCGTDSCRAERHKEFANLMGRELYAGILVANTEHVQIEDCIFETLNCGVVGVGWSGRKDINFGRLSIRRSSFSNCDFGVLIQQFSHCEIIGISGSNTAKRSFHHPHLIYTTDRSAAPIQKLHIARVKDSSNVHSSSIKVRNVKRAYLDSIDLDRCSRGLDFNWVDEADLRNLRFTNPASVETTLRTVLDVRECNRLTATNCEATIGKNLIIANSRDDGKTEILNSISFKNWHVQNIGRSDINGMLRLSDTKHVSIDGMVINVAECIKKINIFRGLNTAININIKESYINSPCTETSKPLLQVILPEETNFVANLERLERFQLE
ncbi:hypothetical protein AAII07_30135 [Microvirga sp. 0TCS3.31]